MKNTNKTKRRLVPVLATLLSMVGGGTYAADVELVMSNWLPARYPLVVNAIKPWAEQVEEVTAGRVSIRILAKPMGAPPAHYDMAAQGIVDVTVGLHSFTTDDRFLRSRVGQFSFIANDAVSGSEAFWNVYTQKLGAVEEHEGVKLLGLFLHGPGMLHTKTRKIESPEDFTGLKIRAPGGYIADLMTDLGATVLFMPPGEVYEKLSRGVVDGVTFPFDGVAGFKLQDYLDYTLQVPGGLYNTSWFLVMNEAKWNKISPEDQAAIEGVSGASFASLAGKAWDDADLAARHVLEEANVEISKIDPEVLSSIKESATTLEAAWAETVKESGYDGAAALSEIRVMTGVTP